MNSFYKLQVADIKHDTSQSVVVSFDIPEDLKEVFYFQPGQYLTFKTDIDGEEIRRSYSICSSPLESQLSVGIKHVSQGKFSTFANEGLQIGDILETMPPQGRFTLAENAHHVVAFAAGSGITPILSQLKHHLAQSEGCTFTLFYSNKGVDQIMFRETLEGLKNTYMNRFSLYHLLSQENTGSALFNGRLGREKLAEFAARLFQAEEVDQYLLCGPETMIFDIRDALSDLGVPKEKLKFELFTTANATKRPTQVRVVNASTDKSSVTVIMDGHEFKYDQAADDENILDAAIRAGADLPYSCKGGVCSTCRAKVLKGKVDMALNYALEDDEVEAGYILTCQSVPRTNQLTISFDD